MSRIGKSPITIPEGVEIKQVGNDVTAIGPKGQLNWAHPAGITVHIKDNQIIVERANETKQLKAFHGLTRALINNMVIGVHTGFEKKLEMYGVGFNCDIQDGKFMMHIGFCHPVYIDIPEHTEVRIEIKAARGNEEPAKFSIWGINKQVVGELAATIRKVRPPEPYLGKGIRYVGEYVIRKEGKPMVSAG